MSYNLAQRLTSWRNLLQLSVINDLQLSVVVTQNHELFSNHDDDNNATLFIQGILGNLFSNMAAWHGIQRDPVRVAQKHFP